MSGVLLTEFGGDPRLSGPQLKEIEKVAFADPDARILGLDDSYRPVIRAVLGSPPRLVDYALQRNGDPAAPAFKGGSRVLREKWGRR